MTPSITASRTTSSILSPLSTAWASVSCTVDSARGLERRQELHPHVAARRRRRRARRTRARVRRTRPRCRRRRAAAPASGARPHRAAGRRTVVAGIQGGREEPVHRIRSYTVYTPRRMFFRGQIIGKYKILSTIGSGGFGTVYLAEDTWIDKKVALKVPHKQGVDFGELLREPRLLASLNHPNIVTILTAEKQENVFFIVMEFVPGETLEAIIARDGALDIAAGARLHLPDLQRRRPRPPPRRAAPRSAAVERARLRQRPGQGRRLRHLALSRDRGARHDRHRQPAVHGARAVSGQGACSPATSTRSA